MCVCVVLSSNPPNRCPNCRSTNRIEELLNAPVASQTINEIGEAMCCNEAAIKLFGLLNKRIEEGRHLKKRLLRIYANN